MHQETTSWYDAVAALYDLGTFGDVFYRAARREAIDRLRLARGDVAFDLFCGTGVDFPLLRAAVGAEGTIVGVDGSAAMLRRARPRAARNDARLIQADFSTGAGLRRLTDAMRSRGGGAAYLFPLGLTCLPDWRSFFRAVYEAAPGGARFAIMDVHSERLTWGARYLNWIGAAECRRPVWEELKRRAEGFQIETRRPFRVFGAEVLDALVIVASGQKPRPNT